MCGITGAFAPSGQVDGSVFYQAHYLIRHRGPDDEGFVYLKEGKVQTARGSDTISTFSHLPHIQSVAQTQLILGHRRLSILDLSPAGHQPYEFDGLYLTFNGEIFNFLDIKKELIQKGYSFTSQGDTEVLIKAFHCWREEAFGKFNGMWALAIYDNKTQTLYLSRDRFGIKPLFYHISNNTLYFASEMKFILSAAKKDWQLNASAVQSYLHKNKSSFSLDTFWEGIHELPLASTMIFKDGGTSFHKYWEIQYGTTPITAEEAAEQFKYLFEDSLRLRMQSDVEVGTLLSGGLDSTTIVCALQKLGLIDDQNFKSFSGIYDNPKYTETSYIKDTVAQTGLNAAYIKTNPLDLAEDLSQLNKAIEEPFRSMSVYTQLLIYRHLRANTNVKVVLNGQGADELFGGYNGQYLVLLAEQLSKLKAKKFLNELQFLKKYRAQTYVRVFRLNFLKRVGEAFRTPHYFNKDSYTQLTISPLREYFKYDDRTSMQYGVEARAPFMDYRLVEFALQLPTEYKIDQSINKKILREYACNIIPKSVRDRKDKMGFTSPQAIWQRNELKSNFDDTINQILENKTLTIQHLANKYADYQNNNKGDFFYFWRVYNLYHWMKDWKAA